MAFNWTDELKTGNDIIDGEHKQLIRAINALLDACSEGRGRQIIEKAVNFLVEYTINHFAHEEKLQLECSFPEYKEHKAFHDGYIKQIQQIKDKLTETGATIAMVADVNLKAGILINHIKTSDKRLAKFIQDNS